MLRQYWATTLKSEKSVTKSGSLMERNWRTAASSAGRQSRKARSRGKARGAAGSARWRSMRPSTSSSAALWKTSFRNWKILAVRMLLPRWASIIPVTPSSTRSRLSSSTCHSCCPASAKEMLSQSMKAGCATPALLPSMQEMSGWHWLTAHSAAISLARASGCESRIWFSCNSQSARILMQLSPLEVTIAGSREKFAWKSEQTPKKVSTFRAVRGEPGSLRRAARKLRPRSKNVFKTCKQFSALSGSLCAVAYPLRTAKTCARIVCLNSRVRVTSGSMRSSESMISSTQQTASLCECLLSFSMKPLRACASWRAAARSSLSTERLVTSARRSRSKQAWQRLMLSWCGSTARKFSSAASTSRRTCSRPEQIAERKASLLMSSIARVGCAYLRSQELPSGGGRRTSGRQSAMMASRCRRRKACSSSARGSSWRSRSLAARRASRRQGRSTSARHSGALPFSYQAI